MERRDRPNEMVLLREWTSRSIRARQGQPFSINKMACLSSQLMCLQARVRCLSKGRLVAATWSLRHHFMTTRERHFARIRYALLSSGRAIEFAEPFDEI
jgi:hypothetical protein